MAIEDSVPNILISVLDTARYSVTILQAACEYNIYMYYIICLWYDLYTYNTSHMGSPVHMLLDDNKVVENASLVEKPPATRQRFRMDRE